jgi:hypothetical protein
MEVMLTLIERQCSRAACKRYILLSTGLNQVQTADRNLDPGCRWVILAPGCRIQRGILSRNILGQDVRSRVLRPAEPFNPHAVA